jgi:hypothetical protein
MLLGDSFSPGFAVGVVARRLKPKRNAQLEQFFDEGISIDMVRKKIVKQALQQGFTSRSRWLLQILGLTSARVRIDCLYFISIKKPGF